MFKVKVNIDECLFFQPCQIFSSFFAVFKISSDTLKILEMFSASEISHDVIPTLTSSKLISRFSSLSKLYAEKHSEVSILYADVVRYTQMTTQLPVRTLVETLHELFVKFDEASAVSFVKLKMSPVIKNIIFHCSGAQCFADKISGRLLLRRVGFAD